MHPKYLSIADFSYILPEEKIAKYPLSERDSSKLLVYQNKTIAETEYKNISQYLPANSLLVFNNTKVIEARILFQKPTGAFIEIFCLEPHEQYGDITNALSQTASVVWLCLIRGASKWKHGQVLQKKVVLPGREVIMQAEFLERTGESFAIRISWTPSELRFADVLHLAGSIPLPPYLRREAESADQQRYQTMFAQVEGSVASPTAGLHFTDAIFQKLAMKQIATDYVTLHVGAGTFKPVKAGNLEHHDMHAEFIDVPVATIKNIIDQANGFITAVGTTSLRTIESLYWMGVKLLLNKSSSLHQLSVKQWEPYDLNDHGVTTEEALHALCQWMEDKQIPRLLTKTQILIAPGYEMKVAHALVTNFHQPNSTLLLLVAAFAGDQWRQIYDYALENQFRFLSYGDGCLLFRN